MNNQSDIQQEQSKLSLVLNKLVDAKDFLQKTIEDQNKGILDRLKQFRDSPESGNDMGIFFNQLEQQSSTFNLHDKVTRLQELEYLLNEPYFARIDLFNHKDKKESSYYIGKFGYTEDNPVITDWRTKVASVFYRYRYPQKNVQYNTPGGLETADLLLKRTFEIDNRQITKVYNNDLQLDENEIIKDKINKRTGGVLEDIIETIQESQLDIIESDPRQVTIVQGTVGSGKSTVAIHKLAHIFFNFPQIIKANNSLMLAKNQILVGYLSTLFPRLGIFDVTYKTLNDLVYNLIFRENIKLNFDLHKNIDTADFNLEYKYEIDTKIKLIHDKYKSKIENIFSHKDYESYSGFKYSYKDSVLQNIQETIDEMQEEYKSQLSLAKEYANTPRAWVYKENIKTLKKLIYKISSLKDELKTKDFKTLIKEYMNTNEELGYYEVLLYIYLFINVIGLNELKKYDYCVVDEGQDFSILEYSILSVFVTRGRFAIFGDLNQSIIENGITSWEDISSVIKEAKHAQVFKLETNYRSTKPIIDLANKILSNYSNQYLPKSINRKGNEPTIKTYKSNNDMMSDFYNDIKDKIANPSSSIGIIAYDENTLKEINDFVEKNIKDKDQHIKLNQNSKITYQPKAVYVTHFDNCKGLEFADVYIVGLNLDSIDNFSKAKKAFVAVTRAMNNVTILGIENN